jgi:hypothetical protein
LLRVDQVVDGIDVDRHAVRNVDRHAVDGSDHAPARAAAAGIGSRTAGRRRGLRRAGAARPVFVGGRAGGRGAPPASGLPALARHPEWDAIARLQIPPSLLYADDHDHAIFRYNNSNRYVRAVNDYAAVLASDPAVFAGYHRWVIYYHTTAGDVLLPVGYVATSPIPVTDYLATHPQ